MPGYATAREVGAALRARRVELGLTQQQVADRAHVSRQWLIKLEDGHPGAELGKILAVIHALGLLLAVTGKPVQDPGDSIDLDQILQEYT